MTRKRIPRWALLCLLAIPMPFMYSCVQLNAAYAGANLVKGAISSHTQKKSDKLPDEYTAASESFDDPLMSKEKILSALNKEVSVLKLSIGSGADYDVIRDNNNLILFKQNAKPIYAVYKTKSGECFYSRCLFRRAYEGGAVYSSPQFALFGDQTLIDCEKVK